VLLYLCSLEYGYHHPCVRVSCYACYQASEDKISFDLDVAKRYKGEIGELQARAVAAAYTVV
jgi:hypothetical protein